MPSISFVSRQSNIPSNRWYIVRIFQIWQAPVGYEELAGRLEPAIRNSSIFRMNNKGFLSIAAEIQLFGRRIKKVYGDQSVDFKMTSI